MSTHVVMSTLKRCCRYGEVAALCSAWIGPPPKALPALPQHSCCYVSHNFRSPGDDTMTACATSRARHAIHSIGEAPTPWLKQEPHPSAAKRKRRL